MAMNKFIMPVLFILLLGGCTSIQHISKTDINYTVVKAESAPQGDAQVNAIIEPYKAQLDAVMNEVLGVLPIDLSKQKPESTLGNWVADAMLEHLVKEGYPVDLAIVNYGGLRVPYLTKGELTRGELFELSPFDNTIHVVDVPGAKLDSVFIMIAESDGWPVSKSVNLTIGNKKVLKAQIMNQPINPEKIYKVATLDYVANGGDNMKVFIPLSRVQTSFLLRDILIAYVKEATATGRSINPVLDGRIINQ